LISIGTEIELRKRRINPKKGWGIWSHSSKIQSFPWKI